VRSFDSSDDVGVETIPDSVDNFVVYIILKVSSDVIILPVKP